MKFHNAVMKLLGKGYKVISHSEIGESDSWMIFRKSKTQVKCLYPLRDGLVHEFIVQKSEDVDNNPRQAKENRKICKTIKSVVQNTK